MARVASLTSNSSSAPTVVRLAVRSYRDSESAARDLISTIYNLVDRDLEATASLIVPLVDLLDNEEKKQDLLAAYNGFKIEVTCRHRFYIIVIHSLSRLATRTIS